MVSASSQTLAEESEDWCVDNYWSTAVADAVVVVTVSAAVVLLWCCQMLVLEECCCCGCAGARVLAARGLGLGSGPLTLGSRQQCAAAGPRQSSDTVIVTLHQQHRPRLVS